MATLFLSVRAKGLEPIRLSAPDPKSGLATNYNTPAEIAECPVSDRTGQVCKDMDKNRKNKLYFFLNWAQHQLSILSDLTNPSPDLSAIPDIIGKSSV